MKSYTDTLTMNKKGTWDKLPSEERKDKIWRVQAISAPS